MATASVQQQPIAYPAHRYNKETLSWEAVEPTETKVDSLPAKRPKNGSTVPSLRLVTYNVWFGSYCAVPRFRGLIDVVKQQNPDYICFQEVTEFFMRMLRDDPWVRENYCLCDPHGNSFRYGGVYGVTMLARANPVDNVFRCHKCFPTTMNRSMIEARFAVGDKELTVATMHLESLEYSDVRETQLGLAKEILSDRENVVFAGDFNICGTWALENAHIEALGMKDAWAVLHGADGEEGWTENGFENQMLVYTRERQAGSHHGRAPRKVRFDRVLVGSPHWSPADIVILGDSPLDADPELPIWVSDHYGLCCALESAEDGPALRKLLKKSTIVCAPPKVRPVQPEREPKRDADTDSYVSVPSRDGTPAICCDSGSA